MKDIYHEPDRIGFNHLGQPGTEEEYFYLTAHWGDLSHKTDDVLRKETVYRSAWFGRGGYPDIDVRKRVFTNWAKRKGILNFKHGLEIASRDDIVNRYKQVCTPKKRRAVMRLI